MNTRSESRNWTSAARAPCTAAVSGATRTGLSCWRRERLYFCCHGCPRRGVEPVEKRTHLSFEIIRKAGAAQDVTCLERLGGGGITERKVCAERRTLQENARMCSLYVCQHTHVGLELIWRHVASFCSRAAPHFMLWF